MILSHDTLRLWNGTVTWVLLGSRFGRHFTDACSSLATPLASNGAVQHEPSDSAAKPAGHDADVRRFAMCQYRVDQRQITRRIREYPR
jgi:hypothetical protein